MWKQLAFAAILVVAPAAASLVQQQEQKPEHEVSYNIGVVSDYRFRGISQTRLDPALQGGADYKHNPTGLYAGTWLSTIKWIKDTPNAGSAPVEWDIYGGKKGDIGDKGVTYDVGGLAYIYVDNRLSDAGLNDADTFEIYGQLGYGPAYAKYSLALTNLFGNLDSRYSGYLDIGANLDLPSEFKLNLHAGHQYVRGPAPASYTDYKVGVSRDIKQLGGATLGVAFVGTNANETFYASPANGKFLGKNGVVFSLVKTF